MKKIKLLLLNNTAGSLTPVVDWIVEQGHEARIIKLKRLDIYGMTSCSPNAVMVDTPREFYQQMIELMRVFKPTHIHASSSPIMVGFVRMLSLQIPVVLQYHGSDIRLRIHQGKKPMWQAALADKIIVSTPDLKPYGELYDRPIHRQFEYKGGRVPGTALMFWNPEWKKTNPDLIVDTPVVDRLTLAEQVAKHLNLKLTIRDCVEDKIPYEEMPDLLSKYEYLFDFKGVSGALSKIAMEAFACGCKVIHDGDPFGEPINAVPKTTKRDFLDLYLSLERASKWTAIKRIPRVLFSNHKRILYLIAGLVLRKVKRQ